MNIHYQEINLGLRAAYLCQPQGNIDEIIRKALDMEKVHLSHQIQPGHPYILETSSFTLYHNPLTSLQDTYCRVLLPKETGPAVVGISSHLRLPRENLEQMILLSIINKTLIPAGLIPIASERDQIPSYFLRESEKRR